MLVKTMRRRWACQGFLVAIAIALSFSNGELLAQETLTALPGSPVLPNIFTDDQQGGSSLIKSGSGTLELITNSNTFCGNTSIDAGGLIINSSALSAANAFSGGTLSADIHTGAPAAGTLRIGSYEGITVDTSFQGSIVHGDATGEINPSGCITLAGFATFGGSIRWNIRDGAFTSETGALTFTKTDPVIINPRDTASNGTIALGSGTISLANNNTFSGSTTLSGGTLTLDGAIFSGAGTLQVNPNPAITLGTLEVNGTLTDNGACTVTLNAVDTISGTDTILIPAGTLNVSYPIDTLNSGSTVSGTLVLNNPGVLTVNSATLSGGTLTATTISQGTLTLGPGSNVVLKPVNGGSLVLQNPEASAPEPSTFVLLITVVLGLVLAAWRKKCA